MEGEKFQDIIDGKYFPLVICFSGEDGELEYGEEGFEISASG